MAQLRLRPRITRTSPHAPDAVLRRIDVALESDGSVTGKVFNSSAVLRVPAAERHFWSPHLEIGVEPCPEGGTELRGIFGPRPAIWSIFVAAYAAIGFLGVMGVTFGASQILLGHAAWALWAGPAALGAALLVYLIARIGRRLGYSQMVKLLTWTEQVAETRERFQDD